MNSGKPSLNYLTDFARGEAGAGAWIQSDGTTRVGHLNRFSVVLNRYVIAEVDDVELCASAFGSDSDLAGLGGHALAGADFGGTTENLHRGAGGLAG